MTQNCVRMAAFVSSFRNLGSTTFTICCGASKSSSPTITTKTFVTPASWTSNGDEKATLDAKCERMLANAIDKSDEEIARIRLSIAMM